MPVVGRALFLLLALLPFLGPSLHAKSFVLGPFRNASSNASINWIGEAVVESSTDALAEAGLTVVDRSDWTLALSNAGIRDENRLSQASMIRVAGSLDADVLILGQFDYTPPSDPKAAVTEGQLRISARILNVNELERVAAFALSGKLADLARILADFHWELVSRAGSRRWPTRDSYVSAHPPIRVDAIENYVRGMRSVDPAQRVRLLANSWRLDNKFAKPALELGLINFRKKQYKQAAEWLQRVDAESRRGHEAQFFLGLARFHQGDYPGAQSVFQQLSNSVPVNEVWNNLGVALSRIGHPDALLALEKAMQGDPGDADYAFNYGYALWKQARYKEAAEVFQSALARNPSDTQLRAYLERSQLQVPATDIRSPAQERVKETFNESVYLALKSLIENRARP